MEQLLGIPERMYKWNLNLELPYPSMYGEYGVVDIQPASVEQHHEVWVIDENERPLRGIGVVFGFSTGESIIKPRVNHWRGSPAVVRGNMQYTDYTGGVKHTFGEGGEDIWIWDMDAQSVLKLPSTIVKNCSSVQDRFIHTGVQIVFKRFTDAETDRERMDDFERRITLLEHR